MSVHYGWLTRRTQALSVALWCFELKKVKPVMLKYSLSLLDDVLH